MQTKKSNRLRIDNGVWRGRYIKFSDTGQIRPTKALVKKTVFNWLRPHLLRSNCLDMYSGSGSLGFEAASIGAKKVVFIDADSRHIKAIEKNIATLPAEDKELHAYSWTMPGLPKHTFTQAYDIVFIDPPFDEDYALASLKWLDQHQLLQNGGLVYLEMQKQQPWPEHAKFTNIKHKCSGGVQYGVMQYSKEAS